MGYEKIWKVLDNLIIELRKKGETVPPNIIDDLRSAKTLMQVLKADPSHMENVPKIEALLESVESYVMLVAQDKFEARVYEEWMKRLNEARKEAYEEEIGIEAASRFIPGVPKDSFWMRIQVSDEMPKQVIEKLAKKNELSCKFQEDGYLLVYGDKEKVKSFVKVMTERFRKPK
jgi:hypothetical protein